MATDDKRIYVGNVPSGYNEADIRELFTKYGEVVNVDLKNKRGPPHFAFVEFADARDAEDAVRGRDGYRTEGHALHVEFTRGNSSSTTGGGPRMGGGVTRRGGISGTPAFRGIGFRVYVSGLPATGSWQDLKDHMRQAGDVCSADVDRTGEGSGWCEFVREEDAKYAVKKLDDTKFRSHKGETSYIRVFLNEGDERRSRSRSPRGGGRRLAARESPTYSPVHRRRHRRRRSTTSSSSGSRSREESESDSSRSRSRSRKRHRKRSKHGGGRRHKKSSSRKSRRKKRSRRRSRSASRSRSRSRSPSNSGSDGAGGRSRSRSDSKSR